METGSLYRFHPDQENLPSKLARPIHIGHDPMVNAEPVMGALVWGALERCPPEGHDGKRSLHGALRARVLGIGLGNTRNALTAMHEQNGVSLELCPG